MRSRAPWRVERQPGTGYGNRRSDPKRIKGAAARRGCARAEQFREAPGMGGFRELILNRARRLRGTMELYRAFDCAQQLSALSYQLSAISYQPSALSYQPSALSSRRSALGAQPSALRYQYHFSGLSGIVLPSGC